jgi:adenylyltransferase/sulfurtransferase
VGKSKASTAATRLKNLNPDIQFQVFNTRLQNDNALEVIRKFDLVIDGTDNFSTRYLINDACVLLCKPLVYGAVLRFEGQVGVFNMADKETNIITNYRDLFPEPPLPDSVLSCNEAGVLGGLPGIIGIMQATEAIKIITGIGKPLCNTIVSYNCLSNCLRNQFYEFKVTPAEKINSLIPGTESAFLNFDYDWFCGAGLHPYEIPAGEFDILRMKEEITIIDVREKEELPVVNEFLFTQIPFSRYEETISNISTNNKIVVFCQSGKRSLKAVKMLVEKFPGCKAYSLKGGIEAWKKNNSEISV